jgi:hypothetical protein
LTSGVTKTPPSFPALVTVNVPSRSSSGRDDESLAGLYGDPDVVALQVDDLVAFEAGVQLRELLERGGGRLQRQWDELLDVESREIALLDERDGGHLAVRPRQVLNDLAPHPTHWLTPSFRDFVFL